MTWHVETKADGAWRATGATGACPACKAPLVNPGHETLEGAQRSASRYKGQVRIVKIYRPGLAYVVAPCPVGHAP